MKLILHGVRGSRPTHKKDLMGYGGNSTSIQFILPNEEFYIFLDGGSGLAHQSPKFQNIKNGKFHFLITHTHWDHILGFPFFEPFYEKSNEVTLYASSTSKADFIDLFLGLQKQSHFPIPKDRIKSNFQFQSIAPKSTFLIENKVQVSTLQLNHQGITLAYRLEYKGCSVAIITDNAPIENGNYMGEGMQKRAQADPLKFEASFDADLVHFLKDCHTVVFDTHFTEENLKPDWGHSTPPRALHFAKLANIKRLILFHHAPEDSDKDVQAKLDSVQAEGLAAGIEVLAAIEGKVWTLK